jgi:OOP family OmpA-OmpF porin
MRTGTTATALGVSAAVNATKADLQAHTVTLGRALNLRCATCAAVAPQQQMFIVFFEFDKSALAANGKKVVDAAAAAFKSGKPGVAIAGYTDFSGQQYDLALSKRPDMVKAALVKDGVPASVIDENWHGKENPRVPTADGVREPQNRHVEITM